MFFRQVGDEKLAQYAYFIGCERTGEALVVDPERDIDRYVTLARSEGFRITAAAETHIHADFLSGARELAERLGARLYLSDEGDADWKYEWAKNGDYDVRLLKDGDTFRLGGIEIQAVHTPGHTPEHLAFLVTDAAGGATEPMGILTGDFVFVGDVGRPDLLETAANVQGSMEPSARRLHASIGPFLELPDHLQVWPAHGAGSACGKALGAVPQTTVGYEKRFNAAIDFARRGEDAFVEFILAGQPEPSPYFARMKRQNKLGVPRLLHLPTPRRMSSEELADLLGRDDTVVIDTRSDRSGFLARHAPDSLYAPLDRRFSAVVGTFAEAEEPICLIVGDENVDLAVRGLVRIGYDRIVGYAPPETLERHFTEGGPVGTIEEIDFAELQKASASGRGRPLDVRYTSEYRAAHVPEALHASFTRLPEHLEELGGASPLLVYCQSGARAASASAYLARQGLPVRSVNDAFGSFAGRRDVGVSEGLLPLGAP